MMLTQLRRVTGILIGLTLVTGICYPLVVTGIAQVVFPYRANGSMLMRDGKAVGSALLGQTFTNPGYFWSRPSATVPHLYNGAASSGTNYSPAHPNLRAMVQARIAALRRADPENSAPIPVDLVTASASGLDPHISPAAAVYQAARVARARGLDKTRMDALIAEHVQPRLFGVLGEPVVSVLELNLALDALSR